MGRGVPPSRDSKRTTASCAALDGDGTITSSFDLTVPELERASAASTLYRDTVAGNLFTNNFNWAQDAVHRVICQNAKLPHAHGGLRLAGTRLLDMQPENVTFVLDEESRQRAKCRIAMKEDGIYVVRKGFVVIVR